MQKSEGGLCPPYEACRRYMGRESCDAGAESDLRISNTLPSSKSALRPTASKTGFLAALYGCDDMTHTARFVPTLATKRLACVYPSAVVQTET